MTTPPRNSAQASCWLAARELRRALNLKAVVPSRADREMLRFKLDCLDKALRVLSDERESMELEHRDAMVRAEDEL